MNSAAAIAHVKHVFAQYRKLVAADKAIISGLIGGKLYEFYCLARTVEAITSRYSCAARLVGSHVQFQSSPGAIRRSDPHFELGSHGRPTINMYTDIEFETLGSSRNKVSDFSGAHELDIVAVTPGTVGKPKYDQILLGVECKSNAKFGKWILKQTLGVRRELSYYAHVPQDSGLDRVMRQLTTKVNAEPPSEYWLAYADPRGNSYDESPAAFSIAFKHWAP